MLMPIDTFEIEAGVLADDPDGQHPPTRSLRKGRVSRQQRRRLHLCALLLAATVLIWGSVVAAAYVGWRGLSVRIQHATATDLCSSELPITLVVSADNPSFSRVGASRVTATISGAEGRDLLRFATSDISLPPGKSVVQITVIVLAADAAQLGKLLSDLSSSAGALSISASAMVESAVFFPVRYTYSTAIGMNSGGLGTVIGVDTVSGVHRGPHTAANDMPGSISATFFSLNDTRQMLSIGVKVTLRKLLSKLTVQVPPFRLQCSLCCGKRIEARSFAGINSEGTIELSKLRQASEIPLTIAIATEQVQQARAAAQNILHRLHQPVTFQFSGLPQKDPGSSSCMFTSILAAAVFTIQVLPSAVFASSIAAGTPAPAGSAAKIPVEPYNATVTMVPGRYVGETYAFFTQLRMSVFVHHGSSQIDVLLDSSGDASAVHIQCFNEPYKIRTTGFVELPGSHIPGECLQNELVLNNVRLLSVRYNYFEKTVAVWGHKIIDIKFILKWEAGNHRDSSAVHSSFLALHHATISSNKAALTVATTLGGAKPGGIVETLMRGFSSAFPTRIWLMELLLWDGTEQYISKGPPFISLALNLTAANANASAVVATFAATTQGTATACELAWTHWYSGHINWPISARVHFRNPDTTVITQLLDELDFNVNLPVSVEGQIGQQFSEPLPFVIDSSTANTLVLGYNGSLPAAGAPFQLVGGGTVEVGGLLVKIRDKFTRQPLGSASYESIPPNLEPEAKATVNISNGTAVTQYFINRFAESQSAVLVASVTIDGVSETTGDDVGAGFAFEVEMPFGKLSHRLCTAIPMITNVELLSSSFEVGLQEDCWSCRMSLSCNPVIDISVATKIPLLFDLAIKNFVAHAFLSNPSNVILNFGFMNTPSYCSDQHYPIGYVAPVCAAEQGVHFQGSEYRQVPLRFQFCPLTGPDQVPGGSCPDPGPCIGSAPNLTRPPPTVQESCARMGSAMCNEAQLTVAEMITCATESITMGQVKVTLKGSATFVIQNFSIDAQFILRNATNMGVGCSKTSTGVQATAATCGSPVL
jgi:hypothetical protein